MRIRVEGLTRPKYWFSIAVRTIKCLSVLSTFTVNKFKENAIIYLIQTLCIFHLYVTYFNLLLLSMTICTLSLSKLCFILSIFFFFFSLPSLVHLSNSVNHLEIFFLFCSYCVSVIIFLPEVPFFAMLTNLGFCLLTVLSPNGGGLFTFLRLSGGSCLCHLSSGN